MAYGSLYNFSLSDFIYDVNIELMMFAIIFLIFTALVRYALVKRIMNDNKTSASIIAICVGLLASYGLVKSGISIQWLTAIHISPEFLVNILPWLILLIAAGIVIKWGFGVLLMIFGAILAIAGFSDLIYARAFGIGVGITLFLIGLALLKKHRKHVARGVGKVGRGAWKGAKYAGRGAWKGAKYAGSKNYRYQQTKNRRRRKATKRRTKSKKKQDYERHQNAKERLRRMRSKGFEPGKGGYSKKNRGPTGRERKERTEWEWKEKQRKAKREEEKERREKAQQEEQERKNQETRNQQRREKAQQEEEQKEKEEQRKAKREEEKERREKAQQEEQERKNQETRNQQRREKAQQEEEQKEKEEQRKANRKTQKEKEEREQKEKYDQRKKEQQEQERKNQEKANEANNLRRNWTRDGPQIIQMVKEMNPNIKTIYKQLMMKYHPDKNPNAIEEATRISQELNRIYSEYKKNTRK